jgi:hypothetical protein
VTITDASVLVDIDTAEDLEAARLHLAQLKATS